MQHFLRGLNTPTIHHTVRMLIKTLALNVSQRKIEINQSTSCEMISQHCDPSLLPCVLLVDILVKVSSVGPLRDLLHLSEIH